MSGSFIIIFLLLAGSCLKQPLQDGLSTEARRRRANTIFKLYYQRAMFILVCIHEMGGWGIWKKMGV